MSETQARQAFHAEGRYHRVWGNHDDIWSFRDRVRSLLEPVYGAGFQVHEGLLMRVVDGDGPRGELFLVHGHQGTVMSDRWSKLARIPVRLVWRNLQRLFNISVNTQARDWLLRTRHNVAMHAWAADRADTVLIAGHTHRPVFKSDTHAEQVQEELDAARAKLASDPGSETLGLEVARRAAELEWVRSQGIGDDGPDGVVPMEGWCYFNTGCCSYMDGDITGLEIADGEIRLVRWPDDEHRPRPEVLARQSLETLFPGGGRIGPASA